MNKTLSPLRTSLYLVLKLLEMNCRCRQGKGKKNGKGESIETPNQFAQWSLLSLDGDIRVGNVGSGGNEPQHPMRSSRPHFT